jgi:hypothetical protein
LPPQSSHPFAVFWWREQLRIFVVIFYIYHYKSISFLLALL